MSDRTKINPVLLWSLVGVGVIIVGLAAWSASTKTVDPTGDDQLRKTGWAEFKPKHRCTEEQISQQGSSDVVYQYTCTDKKIKFVTSNPATPPDNWTPEPPYVLQVSDKPASDD